MPRSLDFALSVLALNHTRLSHLNALVTFDAAALQRILMFWADRGVITLAAAKREARTLREKDVFGIFNLAPEDSGLTCFHIEVIFVLLGHLGVSADADAFRTIRSEFEATCCVLDAQKSKLKTIKREITVKSESPMESKVTKTNVKQEQHPTHTNTPSGKSRRQFYDTCDRAMLVALLDSRDSLVLRLQHRIVNLAGKLKKFKKEFKRNLSKWSRVGKLHRKNIAKPLHDGYHIGKGQKRARLSPFGGVSLAVMRSVTAQGAWRVGLSAGTDVSRQTLCRWEATCDEALDKHSADWYADKETRLRKPLPQEHTSTSRFDNVPSQWGCHAVRSDASNKTVLHREAVEVPS